jgi:hypothetical protein
MNGMIGGGVISSTYSIQGDYSICDTRYNLEVCAHRFEGNIGGDWMAVDRQLG